MPRGPTMQRNEKTALPAGGAVFICKFVCKFYRFAASKSVLRDTVGVLPKSRYPLKLQGKIPQPLKIKDCGNGGGEGVCAPEKRRL